MTSVTGGKTPLIDLQLVILAPHRPTSGCRLPSEQSALERRLHARAVAVLGDLLVLRLRARQVDGDIAPSASLAPWGIPDRLLLQVALYSEPCP